MLDESTGVLNDFSSELRLHFGVLHCNDLSAMMTMLDYHPMISLKCLMELAK